MIKNVQLVAFAALTLTLVGCSGSGNDTPMNRKLALGDQWVLSGSIVNDSGSKNVSVAIDIVNKDLDGATYLAMSRDRSIDGVHKSTDGNLFTQGVDNRDITTVGQFHDSDAPTADTHELFLPGNLTVGYTWSVLNDPDDSTDDQTFTVVSREDVTTPAGTFDTFKIHGDTVDGASSDRWLAPSIGYFAKTVNTRATASGTEVETKVLASTNVSH